MYEMFDKLIKLLIDFIQKQMDVLHHQGNCRSHSANNQDHLFKR